MKPTLLILAAGIGSRYGGVKQMDEVGPAGESIIDYSVFDAIRAGFGKVVFVINPKIEKEFKAIYEDRLKGKIETIYVLQENDNIPAGLVVNQKRVKPWGTGHAVLVAREVVNEPFAVINADDFYGKDAFMVIGKHLSGLCNSDMAYAMVGYLLKNTLSDNGSVSRGVCSVKNGKLTDVVERTAIVRTENGIAYEMDGKQVNIDENTLVSMNFWGFTPKYFEQSEDYFRAFIQDHAEDMKSEFYIPFVVNKLIQEKKAYVRVLESNDQWFGITYQQDKAITIAKIKELTEANIYPENLWQ